MSSEVDRHQLRVPVTMRHVLIITPPPKVHSSHTGSSSLRMAASFLAHPSLRNCALPKRLLSSSNIKTSDGLVPAALQTLPGHLSASSVPLAPASLRRTQLGGTHVS